MLGSSLGISIEDVCQEHETPLHLSAHQLSSHGCWDAWSCERQWLCAAPTTPHFNLMFSASLGIISLL